MSAISKSLRVRQSIYQIAAQQQNNNSKQNHTVQLLFFPIPGHRPAAGTSSPAARQGQTPPTGFLPSSNPSYPWLLSLIEIRPYPMRRFPNLDRQRGHPDNGTDCSQAQQQILCHKLVLLSQFPGKQNAQPLFAFTAYRNL